MLDINSEITEIRITQPRLALLLEKVRNAINQTANALGVDSTAYQSPPDAPQNLDVKAANGLVHATITDSSKRSRALNYFLEADTDPAFSAPHVFHLGATRGAFITFPNLTDAAAPQPWHFRAYSMLPGSTQPSSSVYFGSVAAPTPVTVGGSTQLTPLTSTGSGTASTTGQQGLSGFGVPQFSRPEKPGALDT